MLGLFGNGGNIGKNRWFLEFSFEDSIKLGLIGGLGNILGLFGGGGIIGKKMKDFDNFHL